ncbi:hypothetical protein GW17_00043545 [Ensete ventricosum]|nr:hypothetical protein GW17_00043545 [Ensete ventricosum]
MRRSNLADEGSLTGDGSFDLSVRTGVPSSSQYRYGTGTGRYAQCNCPVAGGPRTGNMTDRPWSEAPYKDAAEKNVLGGLSLEGFLSERLFSPRYHPKSTGNDRFRSSPATIGRSRLISIVDGRFRAISVEGGRKNKEGEEYLESALLFARGQRITNAIRRLRAISSPHAVTNLIGLPKSCGTIACPSAKVSLFETSYGPLGPIKETTG